MNIRIRKALSRDLEALLQIEQSCFSSDRMSRRSFRHHIQTPDSVLLIAEGDSPEGEDRVLGYGLCLLRKGTRLARLYSLAVLPDQRGLALGERLLLACERSAQRQGRLFMRLEVSVKNQAAIALYERSGYRRFGEYHDYYEDHQDALRLQKVIHKAEGGCKLLAASWYQQTTDFTCGPAALMMAISALEPQRTCDQSLEIQLWREATTVFMTSGLGGTHPFGLALAAKNRGFHPQVYLNTEQELFIDGVRTEKKKEIMTLVHNQFKAQCQSKRIAINYQDITQVHLQRWLKQGRAVLILISTYRLDGKKAPHWVLLTGIDNQCLYVHDPDLDEKWQQPIDCQHLPISRQDFDKMSAFGNRRLRCAITLQPVQS